MAPAMITHGRLFDDQTGADPGIPIAASSAGGNRAKPPVMSLTLLGVM
jgi:hypothetical protein